MADKPRWSYDPKSRRYRDDRGRFLSFEQMFNLRDEFIAGQKKQVGRLAVDLAEERITRRQWEERFREVVKQTFLDQYMLGRGGRKQMTPADYGKVGAAVKSQYAYIQQFAVSISNGELTPAQIRARMDLYIDSSGQMYEAAFVATFEDLELPAIPKDGSTICLGHCMCRWDIREKATEYEAWWTLSDSEHCPDCIERANQWTPLIIPKVRKETAQ